MKKLLIALAITLSFCDTSYDAGIPVIDGTNLPHNVMTSINAYNNVQQSILQLTELKNEFEYTVQNTLAPAFWVWDQYENFDENIANLQKKLNYFSKNGIENYLKQYVSIDFYRNSKCFKIGGCNEKEMAELQAMQLERLNAMRETSTLVAKGISNYLDSKEKMDKDLKLLENKTKKARGRLEAVQYSNQWLSIMTKQLQEVNLNLMTLQQQMRVMTDETYNTESIGKVNWEKNKKMKLHENIMPFKLRELR